MADFTRNSNNPHRSRPWLHPPPIPLHRLPPFSSVPFFPQSTFGPILSPTPQGFTNPPPDPPGFASFRRPPTTPFPNATPSGPRPYDFTRSASRFFTPYSYPNLPPPPQPKWQQNQNLAAYRPPISGPGRHGTGTGVFHSPQINHLPNNITPTHKKTKPRKRRGRRNRKGGGVEASPQMRNVNCSRGDGLGKQEECPQSQHVPNYEMVLPKEWPY